MSNIKKIKEWVISNNLSDHLPYHNTFHILNVTEMALKLCEMENHNEKEIVVVAALFHDINHLGTGKNDDENIRIAIETFRKFNQENKMFDTITERKVIDCIKATRYPYQIPAEQLSKSQKILRDADILQGIFVDDYMNRVVFAIPKELKSNRTEKEIIENQKDFISNMKFITNSANKLYKENLKVAENKIKEYERSNN